MNITEDLHVDDNVSIGTRQTNKQLKLEVTSLLPDQSPDVSPVVGVTTPNAEDFLALSCGNRNDQIAQLTWNRGSLCLGTNAGFDRTSFSEHLRITQTGNVGIGVERPEKKLEVAGEFQSTGVVRAGGGFRSSADHWEIVGDEADLVIREPGQDSEKLRVTSTGNVGIGVLPDHQSKLHLGGGTAAGLAGGGALVIGATDGNNLALDTGGIMARNNMTKSVLNLQTDGGDLAVHGRQGEPSRFVIKDDGKIGVGTPDPIEKLHVAGNILMTGRDFWMHESLRSLHVESGGSQDNYLHINAFGNHPGVKINQNEPRPFDVNSGKLHVSSAGNVGIGTGTAEPGAPLHVADHMVVGPIAATTGQGGIDVTGSSAEFGFVRRDLTAWPANPQAGDRFVWYNKDGTARLWTHEKGDLLSVDADGAVALHGRETLFFNRTNASGTPTGDGFRIRYDDNFFGAYADALIFEKTDFNLADPDGGVAFVNTGSDGVVKHAFTIRGNGKIGIGTKNPGIYKLSIGDTGGQNALHLASDFGLRGADKLNLIKFGNDGDYQMLHKSSGVLERNTLALHVHRDDAFGIYSSGWSSLMELSGGSGDMYLKGNLGIGTKSPGATLDVNGDLYVRGKRIYMSHDGATNNNNDYISYDDSTYLGSPGVFSLHADSVRGADWSKPSAALSAKGGYFSGNVGIGTNEPTGRLDVYSTGSNGAHLIMDGHAITLKGVNDPANYVPRLPYIQWLQADNIRAMYLGWGDTNAKYINLRLENSYDLFISGGNVGIERSNPVHKLDINGNINYGKLTKLDVDENFTATVRAADFKLGYSSRRGSPGRALVDYKTGAGNKQLRLNYGGDWDGVRYYGNWGPVSSRKLKENISSLSDEEALSLLVQLEPVKFNLKADETKKQHLGFIAEDTPAPISDEDKEAVITDYIIAVLTRVLKMNQQKIAEIESRLK